MDVAQIIVAAVGILLILAGILGKRKNWAAFLIGLALVIAAFTAWPFFSHLVKSVTDPIFHPTDWSLYVIVKYTDGSSSRMPNQQPQAFVTMDKTKCIKELEFHLTKPPFSPGTVNAKLWLYWTGHRLFGHDIMGKMVWEKTVTVNFRNGTDAVAYVMPYEELKDIVENELVTFQIPFLNQWNTAVLNMGADLEDKKLEYDHALTLYVSANDNIIQCKGGGTQGPIKIVAVEVEYGTQAIFPQAVDPNSVDTGSSLSVAFISAIASLMSAVAGIITAVRQ